ncbi:MAG TPA: caspase family protein [Nocardioides sp.]
MTGQSWPGQPVGEWHALIIANADYQDPGLKELRAPAADADALARVLSDPDIGGFEVRSVLDQPAHVIAEAVEEFFVDRSPDDLLLVHFSCHGIKDEDGELYFAATNTKLRLLGATAVAANFVNRKMNQSRSRRIVLLLDCCYAGAFQRGMAARAGSQLDLQERFGGRGRAVITASGALEYAFEDQQLTDTGHPSRRSSPRRWCAAWRVATPTATRTGTSASTSSTTTCTTRSAASPPARRPRSGPSACRATCT